MAFGLGLGLKARQFTGLISPRIESILYTQRGLFKPVAGYRFLGTTNRYSGIGYSSPRTLG